MGCTVNKQKLQGRTEERNLLRELKLNLTKSLSNPSLITITSELGLVRLEKSPSMSFDDEAKVAAFQKYARDNNIEEGLANPNVLRTAANLSDVLAMDEHILFISTKIWHLVPRFDPDYLMIFDAASEKNPHPIFAYAGFDLETKFIIHSMFLMRFEKVLISAYEDGKDERVTELYQLLALSHLLMHLTKADFNSWSTVKIKCLIHISALTEENKAAYIYFIHMIYTKICESMDFYLMKSSKDCPQPFYYGSGSELLPSELPSRENYRMLKKWNGLVANLTRGLMKPMEAISKQIEESKQLHYADVNYKEQEVWKIIEILKKGYRFKNLVNRTEFLQEKKYSLKKKSLYGSLPKEI